ncbi:MAG: glycosyltransferase family 39 protein [Paramuribaculum sp.]|nr:glycosyltransferase family 39 protein [Paramuribaculum sp.]
MERNLTNSLGRYIGLLVIVLAAITWLPWLQMILFNTKGEPREAIVAVSIMQSGNWILPVSMGANIPYKPPMLAWLISILSLPFGRVTEYTSRMPSALAAVYLVWATYRFFSRNDGRRDVAALTALVLMTSVEVWRAGWACRVDMVLTAAMVGSLYSMYDWIKRGMKGVPLAASAFMTVAVLTKGPVGCVLPVLCVWLFNLLRPADERQVWSITWKLAVAVIISCILPAAWYILAARQGGNSFLALVYEENIGRATGTMSYASHENGAWYNPMTLAVGMLPYTLAMLFAAFVARWQTVSGRLRGFFTRRNATDRRMVMMFSIVSALTIISFYTIPKSKRSVYLLPMYPFVAYMVTLGLLWLAERCRRLCAVFCGVMGSVVLLVGLLALVGSLMPDSLTERWPMLAHALRSPMSVIMAMIAVRVGFGVLRGLCKSGGRRLAGSSVAGCMVAYWCVSAGILPGILNGKSDKPVAEAAAMVTLPDEYVFQFVDEDMLRYYTANFYLADRIRLFGAGAMPEQGVLMVSEKDFPVWKEKYGGEYSTGSELWHSDRKSCDTKSKVMLIPFVKR